LFCQVRSPLAIAASLLRNAKQQPFAPATVTKGLYASPMPPETAAPASNRTPARGQPCRPLSACHFPRSRPCGPGSSPPWSLTGRDRLVAPASPPYALRLHPVSSTCAITRGPPEPPCEPATFVAYQRRLYTCGGCEPPTRARHERAKALSIFRMHRLPSLSLSPRLCAVLTLDRADDGNVSAVALELIFFLFSFFLSSSRSSGGWHVRGRLSRLRSAAIVRLGAGISGPASLPLSPPRPEARVAVEGVREARPCAEGNVWSSTGLLLLFFCFRWDGLCALLVRGPSEAFVGEAVAACSSKFHFNHEKSICRAPRNGTIHIVAGVTAVEHIPQP
ncbi:hypothetical protein Taro_032588, partial [Colocasia esculenta]|nr:hypothetical protein [Colocasia esculenta]